MKNIKAYECNGSLALDKDYLERLADGKSEVKEGHFLLCLSEIERLKEAHANSFNFSLYNEYLENGKEEAAALYFENHARCISIYDIRAAINSANGGRKNMNNITISINTVNEAFENGYGNMEVARILKDLANKIESGSNPETVRDMNGNKVGTVIYK